MFSSFVRHAIQQSRSKSVTSTQLPRFTIASNYLSTTSNAETETENRTWDGVKYRKNPIVTKITSDLYRSSINEGLRTVNFLIARSDHEVRIAGGAVRDFLLDKTPRDFDLATTATYSQIHEIFSSPAAENVRILNTNLEIHGTVPLKIGGQRIELSALKAYNPPDNKQYDPWLLDAKKRDLTVNSMFMTLDGTVYDYFYGYEDVKQRRIRFVGDPNQRFQDPTRALEILRFFRFFERYSNSTDEPDKTAIDAITANIAILATIDGHRLWTDLKRTIRGVRGCEMLLKMLECGIGPYVGLPDNVDTTKLKRLRETSTTLFRDIRMDAVVVMCSLLNTKEEVDHLVSVLDVGYFDRDLFYFLVKYKHITEKIDDLSQYQLLCRNDWDHSFLVNKQYTLELLKLNGKRTLHDQMLEFEMFEDPEEAARFSKNVPD